MATELLKPLAVLASWTALMWLWMYATRIPAMFRDKAIDLNRMTGGTGTDLDKLLPERVQWVAHNYNHLHEQPTVFYAVVLALAMLGQGQQINLGLAWAYVVLRILHSIWQSVVNTIPVRLALFALSTTALGMLAISAVRATLGL